MTVVQPGQVEVANAIHAALAGEEGPTPPCSDCLEIASNVLAAVRPIIEAEVRERIAADIEAEASDSSYRDTPEATEAYLDAARIARGQS